jgi:hypothetical protein
MADSDNPLIYTTPYTKQQGDVGKVQLKRENSSPDAYLPNKAERAIAHWTVNDQKRLISLDKWHDRLLEYHRNVHAKQLFPSDSDVFLDQPSTDNTLVVADILKFSYSESTTHLPKSLTFHDFSALLSSSSNDNNGFCWIHLKDLSILSVVATHTKMHDLVVAGFRDNRSASTIIPCQDSFLISICSSEMIGFDVCMFKLFMFVSENFVVTFQKVCFFIIDVLTIPICFSLYLTSSFDDI